MDKAVYMRLCVCVCLLFQRIHIGLIHGRKYYVFVGIFGLPVIEGKLPHLLLHCLHKNCSTVHIYNTFT